MTVMRLSSRLQHYSVRQAVTLTRGLRTRTRRQLPPILEVSVPLGLPCQQQHGLAQRHQVLQPRLPRGTCQKYHLRTEDVSMRCCTKCGVVG